MTNRFSRKIIWLVFLLAFVVAGCEQGHKEEVVVYEPLIDPNFIVPDYASRAIEATGGRQAWTKAKKLRLDCVVTFYKSDDSFYLTHHYYEICPWSNSIRISATEPQGNFVWELSRGRFSVLEGAEQVCALPIPVSERFTEEILYITTAPAHFFDKRFGFRKSPDQVKIEGQWYYPIERERIFIGAIPYWSKVVFYQNSDSSLIDMIWHADLEREEFLMVRGYDYHPCLRRGRLAPAEAGVENRGVRIPTKVEIFRTNAAGVLQERLVKLDFY